MHPSPENSELPAEFSLVLGGPLYQTWRRTRMLRPPLELLHRRLLGSVAITWLPLTVLTVIGGNATGGVRVPFLFDLDVHAKLLVVLPLLIAAEVLVHRLLRVIVRQFIEQGLIEPAEEARFGGAVAAAVRLRNSTIVELLMLALAFFGGYWLWKERVALHVATWYGQVTGESIRLTPAGYWYVFVSMPLARFVLLRWYFRLTVWYRFLWTVSRIPLRLNPLHPDRAGGLGFLGQSVFAFAPLLLAHTLLLAAIIAERIWHEDARLPDFQLEIAGLFGLLMLMVLAPLTFFFFQLTRAKRSGLYEYGALAAAYVADFRRKWITGAGPEAAAEPLLGTADLQSLADLANSYDVIREMRVVPINRFSVLRLAILIALPLAPLVLTVIPLEQVLTRLVQVVL
ncbi:MAG: hypothetical protein ACT4QC_08800 [Planctomycetaceae bacterium]